MLEGLLRRLEVATKISHQVAWEYAIQTSSLPLFIRERIISQLQYGENAKGEIMGIYSFATEQISGGKKKAGTPYTLEDTGFFYSTIEVFPNYSYISIFANGQKLNKNLIDVYGIEVIELNKKHMEELQSFFLKEYLSYARNTLQVD
jgi:hypothetical protein